MSTTLKIVSFNTKCLLYSEQKNEIANFIKSLNADIIGIQELDSFTERSGQYDQIKFLGEACDFEYYDFNPSIEYQGGYYGHGILSKYPITYSESIYYKTKSKNDHNRNYSLHIININNKELAFFNTHITLGEEFENGAEIKEVTDRMAQYNLAVLTGDMNMEPNNMGKYVNCNIKVLNGGINFNNFVKTFPQGKKSKTGIDNIFTSKSIITNSDKRGKDAVDVIVTSYSDHNPIYTKITI